MAVVQTNGTLDPTPRLFRVPGTLSGGVIPFGEYIWQGSLNVPAVTSPDQAEATIALTMPQGGDYLRVVEFDGWIQSSANMGQWDGGYLNLSDGDGVRNHIFDLGTQQQLQAAGTTTFGKQFIKQGPQGCLSGVFGALDGSASSLLRVISGGGSTSLTTIFVRMRALRYSTIQRESYPMHTPFPTINP